MPVGDTPGDEHRKDGADEGDGEPAAREHQVQEGDRAL